MFALSDLEEPKAFDLGLLDLLGSARAEVVGAKLVPLLPAMSGLARPAALRIVLARPAGARAFLDAVEAGSIRFDLLALDQKTALATHPDAGVSARAKKLLAAGGGLPDPDRQKVVEKLLPVTKKTGDVGLGKVGLRQTMR